MVWSLGFGFKVLISRFRIQSLRCGDDALGVGFMGLGSEFRIWNFKLGV